MQSKIHFPSLLLIAGTGRNSGKTTLACAIITHFSRLQPVAIKISPHFHLGADGLDVILQENEYNIYRENSITSGKDSAKMLKAGAREVYYMEVLDTHLEVAFKELIKRIGRNIPVVCESPALRKYIKPGTFLIVDSPYTPNKKNDVLEWKDRADCFFNTALDKPEELIDSLWFDSDGWSMKSQ